MILSWRQSADIMREHTNVSPEMIMGLNLSPKKWNFLLNVSFINIEIFALNICYLPSFKYLTLGNDYTGVCILSVQSVRNRIVRQTMGALAV